MSTYTTTIWEYIKDQNDFDPAPIPELIEKYRKTIFDFDYDTPNNVNKEEFKKWFETTFITNFATWEIGFDTWEKFHLKLWSTCSKVMPSYSKRFESMLSVLPRHLFNGQWGTIEREYKNKSDSNSSNKNMGSTLPANMINANAINDVGYATDSSKNESANQGNNQGTSKDTYDIINSFNIDKLSRYNKEITKVYTELFKEFNYLFLGVL